uniref:Rhodanese domain-containing protein n=1 Tax=Aureoumbra lagunensis TaxID=44058 RepID=A0A7S3NPK4_9STRA
MFFLFFFQSCLVFLQVQPVGSLVAIRSNVKRIRHLKSAACDEDDWHRPIEGECNSGVPTGASPLWTYDLSKTSSVVIPSPNDWNLIIDVRSPSEFAEDHMPGAINIPVLTDFERHKVGTLYAQSPFEARKLGAGLVATNLGNALASGSILSKLPRTARILVYCWRGGERSNAAAHIFSRIGWHAARLEGGYKTYRAAVQKWLYNEQIMNRFNFALLQGPTGSYKSHILSTIRASGHQVLDLEVLAGHRGSTLGSVFSSKTSDGSTLSVVPQPSQKAFESKLFTQLWSMDTERVIFVESESARIGRLQIPRALHRKCIAADAGIFELSVPLSIRVKHLRKVYSVFETPAGSIDLKHRLQRLAPRRGKDAVQRWTSLVDRAMWSELVADLLENHYDAAYEDATRRDLRSISSSSEHQLSQRHYTINLGADDDISDEELEVAASNIVQRAQDNIHHCATHRAFA